MRFLIRTALIPAVFLSAPAAAQQVPNLRYAAYCSVGADGTLTGYVTSQGPEPIRVEGVVRFVLFRRGSLGQEELQIMGNGLVPSGGTAQVAQARVNHPVGEDTRCYLDLSQAARADLR